MSYPPHIAVIDPAVKKPEVDCFNHLVSLSPLPLTYHIAAIQGTSTLEREKENLRGIVILGSGSSVNERLPWQVELENWLRPRLEASVPTLGFCYGHQMLAYMFGGRVAYHSPNQEKHVGFREVNVVADPLWGEPQKGQMYVRHNEIVSAVPPCMTVLASSSQVKHDGLKHKTLPIWTFQPHPEATLEFTGGSEDSFNFGYSLIKRFLEFCSRTR